MGAFLISEHFTNAIHHITAYLKKAYSLDTRALSLMRIAVGLVLLVDLFIRSLSIRAFFTDEGVLPVEILKTYNWNPYYFSFHAINGALWWQILLFLLNAFCIVLLIRGYRSRLFTFICWVFLTSLQNRNPFILQGGDDLLRLILLWGIFLPWGERYSAKPSSYPDRSFSYAHVGYILLIASVYFFSALLKTHDEWHSDGTALYYALSLDQLRLPLGTVLYQYPGLMKALTHVVFYLELVAPILLVIPIVNYRIRLTGLIAIALLHIGIAGTLYVGLFYIIGLVTLIGMLPSHWIDRLDARFGIAHRLHPPEETKSGPAFMRETAGALVNGLAVLIIFYCLLLNLGNVKKFPYVLDPSLVKFGNTLRLEQSWGMFSPSVYKEDGFYIYSGYTKTGNYIDLKRNGQPVSYAKPASIVSEFESDRWRKFGENYLFNNNNYMRPYFCKYLIKRWNGQHPENPVSDLTIFFIKEESLPDYQTKAPEKKALCNCQDY